MRWIDADKLLEELNGYDLENTREYKIIVREIENAPTVARTWQEWWRMRMRVQGRRIDNRYKDRPISKEAYKLRMEIYGGIIFVWFVMSVMWFIKMIDVWRH